MAILSFFAVENKVAEFGRARHDPGQPGRERWQMALGG
jgi:hypothetical protein